ncbi:murein L,D-transpeptidase YafK [Pararhizobium capsulatum DSM 1112]|uniref:Murein L,D-transpeptidase YafK n=1 Tax=Pararhizobium capsulatum DSM 1112 TaxID=1121113 RepID=A0ABU0BTR5_9HYPH|nr:murein L,D-transpeptidase family protein [Pararhizobium capsulatum]MDQ0321656.1 murein L,D-transpeptidase YafK [Pararhizobium capsulatum DSM 1112]
MRLRNLVIIAAVAALLAGCTNETLDAFDQADVDIKSVKNKTTYELSGKIVANMRAANMPKNSPVMIRIFKEEGALEIWKATADNRFAKLREYKICAWSGKLGPKVKEGDRQAPEGFYPLGPGQMNPNSSYYLAINTGFPNRYDQANGRHGTDLMIHGACSSSGCYSMTDEQMQEIFALARDAYKGGQQTIQLQALPFRMTAENMARHKNSPNIEFWNMLKVGYDQFEITKRPPEVNICEKKYVFNQQTDGKFNPASQCPAMSTPSTMQVALASYNKKYDQDYTKALKKYDGMVWYEPSEAERKAIVAKQRVGKELAYAPTGTSLDAGKLMKAEELEKLEAKRAELAEAKKAIEIQTAELEKSTRGGKNVPVPVENPMPRPIEQASAETTTAKKSFWSLFGARDVAEPQPAPASTLVEGGPDAAQQPAQQTASVPAQPEKAVQTSATEAKPAAAAAAAPQAAQAGDIAATDQAVIGQPEEAPKKKPFWKFWGK